MSECEAVDAVVAAAEAGDAREALLALFQLLPVEVRVEQSRRVGKRDRDRPRNLDLTIFLEDRTLHYEPDLGGLLKPRKDSPDSGWRNVGFRGYADHGASVTHVP